MGQPGLFAALAAVAALAVAGPVFAQEPSPPATTPPQTVVFLGSANNPPFLWTDSQGTPRGYTAELMRALAKEGGFEVSFDIIRRQQRRQAFRAGRGDVTGLEPGTADAVGTVPLVPLWRSQELVLYRSPHPAPKALADLRDETVAVVEASNQHLSLKALPGAERPAIVAVETIQDALAQLRSGQVSAVFSHSLAVRAAGESITDSDLTVHQLRAVPYILAARAGREDLQKPFNDAYLRLQESGQLMEIIERSMIQPDEDASVGYAVWAALGAVLFGVTGVLGMALWSRSLRREVRRRTQDLREAADRQAMHAHVLSQVADAIVLTDEQRRVVSWNEGAAAIFGRPSSEAMGEPLAALLTNRMATRRDGDLHDALASGRNWRGDAEVVRPSGDTVFIAATVRRVTDEQGRPSGTLLVAHNIDAHRRTEMEASMRARQQAAIASLGQRALAGIDFQWLIDQAMSQLSNTLHVPAVATFELVEGTTLVMRAGDGWQDARPGDTQMVVDRHSYPASALSAEGGAAILDPRRQQPVPVDPFHVREGMASGATVVIPGRSGPFGILVAADRRAHRFSRDDVHFMQAIANVIGAAFERSLIDRELRTELALHNATLEAAADGILVTDARGRVRRFNQRLVSMWGFPPEILSSPEALAWVTWARQQLEGADTQMADFHTAAQSAQPQSVVLRLKDGRVIERHSHPQLVDGKVDGRVWSYRDITDRVKAEDERRRLEAQMQHVQKLESLGVLAGGIAHDFNNLLVGMLGHAGLALTELDPESPAYDRIAQIQTTAQRAAELTNQMLAYSGKGRFVLQSADLSEIVGEMTHLLRTAIAKNAQIVLDLAPSLPAFDGDPAQIRQVIMNLITNASDAIGTAPGSIAVQTGRMHVTRDYVADAWIGGDLPEGEYVFAEVRDTGCGMDAATLARIFDPFFTTKFTGRGLGLAAVLGIVRGHKGGIKISSEPGCGTTFRVLLPATSAPVVRTAVPPKAAPVRAAGGRLLVVDDEAGVRTIARESLKRAGFEVVTVNDGVEAVELLATDQAFQGVLLDMTMPRMNGSEAFRRIRELIPDLPVVLTSGYSAQEAVGRFGDGIDGFIQKPFMPAALVKAMNDAVSQRPRREVA